MIVRGAALPILILTLAAPVVGQVKRSPLVRASDRLALSLYSELLESHADKNLVVSPLSVSLALSVLTNAADGNVLDELRRCLAFDKKTSLPQINRFYSSVLSGVGSRRGNAALRIATRIWLDRSLRPKSEFLDVVRTSFRASTRTLDFGDPRSDDAIRSWFASEPDERPSLPVDAAKQKAVFALTNKIDVETKWLLPFRPKATRKGSFVAANGKRIAAQMMSGRALRRYRRDPAGRYECVKLSSDSGLGAIFVLPQEGSDLTALASALGPQTFRTICDVDGKWVADLILPRFQARCSASLVKPLRSLGVRSAFDVTRGFPAIGPLAAVGTFRAESRIEVNELGCSARTRTTLRVYGGERDPKPITVVFDRPFFFALFDHETGVVLFIGHITDPRGTKG